jgi:hypothetical protein
MIALTYHGLSVPWQLIAAAAFVLIARARRGRRMAAAVLLAVPRMVGWARRVARSHRPRDSRRGFTPDERAAIIARAGYQCEWVDGWKRCEARHGAPGVQLEADHVYPWAFGGPTTLGNGQALCRPHNAKKSGKLPTPQYLWRLAHSRAGYMEVVPRPGRRERAWH